MDWLVIISEGYGENMSYNFSATDEEAAKKQAIKYFDRFTSDTGREYDDEEFLPSVTIYEVPYSISVDVTEHWKEKKEAREKRNKEYIEKREAEEFKRLQKKFDPKPNPPKSG